MPKSDFGQTFRDFFKSRAGDDQASGDITGNMKSTNDTPPPFAPPKQSETGLNLREVNDNIREVGGQSMSMQLPKNPEQQRMNPPETARSYTYHNEPQANIPLAVTTTVSKSTVIEGNIITEDSIEILGEIYGNVETKSTLNVSGKVYGDITAYKIISNDAVISGKVVSHSEIFVGQGTRVVGDVTALTAEINGKIKGNLHIKESVVLGKNAVVIGDIASEMIELQRGAHVKGALLMLNEDDNISADMTPEQINSANNQFQQRTQYQQQYPQQQGYQQQMTYPQPPVNYQQQQQQQPVTYSPPRSQPQEPVTYSPPKPQPQEPVTYSPPKPQSQEPVTYSPPKPQDSTAEQGELEPEFDYESIVNESKKVSEIKLSNSVSDVISQAKSAPDISSLPPIKPSVTEIPIPPPSTPLPDDLTKKPEDSAKKSLKDILSSKLK